MNNKSTYTLKLPTFILLLLGMTFPVLAQRNMTYPMLVKHSRQPRIYYDYVVLPQKNNEKNKVLISFKIENDYLTFKKAVSDNGDQYLKSNKNFEAHVNINLEVFKGDSTLHIDKNKEKRPEQRSDRDDRDRRDRDRFTGQDNIQLPPNKESVTRTFWRGVAKAKTYEETKSHKEYLQGFFSVELKPGYYSAFLQLSEPDISEGKHSTVRIIHVPDYTKEHTSSIIMLDQIKKFDASDKLPLLNFGNNVYYGKNFGILFSVPQNEQGTDYKVEIDNLGTNPTDTSSAKIAYTSDISADNVINNVGLKADTSHNKVYLKLVKDEDPNYAYASIPNSRFANDSYRIKIINNKNNKILTSRIFQSRWLNMPTSLLNLNVSIDMLHFILNKDKVKEMNSGSFKEREQKFREFWKKRDPTPNTQYNELMAEYYRRIDYAWEHFTTINKPGYDTDQGKVYINLGPPDRIERHFPTNGPAIVIWYYGKRKYAFQATSGFGDFELVK